MITIAQIGCGYWGPNLLRNFASNPKCRVKWVVDPRPERRKFVQAHYKHVDVAPEFHVALADPDVDALVISTPSASHVQLALQALAAGKHILVEKPLATTVADVDAIAKAAGDRVVMAGHTFLYNAAVRYLREVVKAGDLGEVYYIYSQRLNLGQVRSDVNVWWNLAPHDISILIYLLQDQAPVSIALQGMTYLQNRIEDVVFATLSWANGVKGHLHLSWLDPGKVRRTTVVGSRKMVVYDDVGDAKITVLDKGVDFVPRLGDRMDFDRFEGYNFVHRDGDIWLPRIKMEEPLRVETNHFLECIERGETPLTGIHHARDVIAVLEAGEQSLRQGREVAIAATGTGAGNAVEVKIPVS
jgi:predicted dehydrogenase